MLLGVSLGDPAGVGPEILVRALDQGLIDQALRVHGEAAALELVEQRLGWRLPAGVELIDTGRLSPGDIPVGMVDERCGAAALAALDAAIADARAGRIDAIVTLPINKAAARGSHPGFAGHTEHLAAAFASERYAMMLVDERLAVSHVSTHVGLAEAIRRLTPRRILEVIQLTREALGGAPRIAVAGLNPHASEGGAFGDEEARAIAPAIAAARAAGIDASGPHPPDTVFMHAFDGRYDAVVAMYHDQGHIPMKAGGIADTVNVTIGLPVIRTSVDHGTAFDIAYRGVADPTNFAAACRHAQRLAQRRGVPA